MRTPVIDPRGHINWDEFTRVIRVEDEQPFIMHPQELVLAATIEEIALPDDMLGRLEGRSVRWGGWESSFTARRRCFSLDFLANA